MWEIVGLATNMALRQVTKKQTVESLGPFVAVAPPLPVDLWVERRGFAFGVPFGWRELDPSELQQVKMTTKGDTSVGLVPVRTDNMTAVLAVTYCAVDGREMFSQAGMVKQIRQQATGYEVFAAPAALVVGGARALVLHMKGEVEGRRYQREMPVQTIETEVWVPRGRATYVIGLGGPSDTHERYMPALWTALGTWRWL